jgi:prolipoprotein diacylglyceryltransferase
MFHLYGLFIGLAIVVGYSVAEKLEPKIAKMAPWMIVLGILGARVYHVIDRWDYYGQNLGQIGAVWNGGLSIWGALIGGLVAWMIVGRRATSILGASVTALPLAQAIGRIGNGVNGEFTTNVFGLPWWSAEMILDLLLFGAMWALNLRGSSSKVKVMTYLVGYGLIRYFLRPYR